MTQQEEIWKDVVGYEQIYQISNLGRAKSVARQRANGVTKERILRPATDKDGYQFIALHGKISPKYAKIHHLVLEAFIGPRPEGMEARHFPDRNPANNQVDNLSWTTSTKNKADKIQHGTSNRGERNCNARFNNDQILAIRQRHLEGETIYSIAQEQKVTWHCINRIVTRERWSHI